MAAREGTAITITIAGDPVPQKRGLINTRGRFARLVAHPRSAAWQKMAAQTARVAMKGRKPLTGPLRVSVIAYFLPPRSWPAWKREAALEGRIWHTTVPDRGNLLKAAEDAMNGVLWVDDAQIVAGPADKYYSNKPHVTITAVPILGAPCQITRKDQLAAAEAL